MDQVLLIGVSLVLLISIAILLIREFWFGGEENKNNEMLYDAMKKAQDIISQSELEGVKIQADNKIYLEKIEKEEEKALSEASVEGKAYIEKAQSAFTDYLTTLSQQANMSVAESEKAVKDRINKLFEEFEQNLSTYLTQTQQESIKAITLEVQAARQLIDTYKTEQFRLVDENLVAMLERTLSLVLIKKLTLKEHVELVYESLEQAKAEKFIL